MDLGGLDGPVRIPWGWADHLLHAAGLQGGGSPEAEEAWDPGRKAAQV